MIWQTLQDTAQPRARYIAKALLLMFPASVLISVLLSIVVYLFFPGYFTEDATPDPTLTQLIIDSLGVMVIPPLVETLIMIPIFKGLRYISSHPLFLMLGSAGIWACLHSLAIPLWGFVVFWPFCVMSYAYLQFEKQEGLKSAYVMTASIHFCNNVLAGGLLFVISLYFLK